MKFAGIVTAVSALLPAALACNGYTGGLPTPVGTKTNSKVIEVAAGAVYDGAWYKYDRGSGACNEQAEGGELSILNTFSLNSTLNDIRGCRRCLPASCGCYSPQCDHWQEPGRGCPLQGPLHTRVCVSVTKGDHGMD